MLLPTPTPNPNLSTPNPNLLTPTPTLPQPYPYPHPPHHKPTPNPTPQSGALSIDELKGILNEASKEFSHLAEHARFLDEKNSRFGGMLKKLVARGPTPANSPL